MPRYTALWKRWWWGTQSKAFEKSMTFPSYSCPSARPLTSTCVKFNIWVSHDLLVLNPCWLCVSREVVSRLDMMCLAIFSKYLQATEVREVSWQDHTSPLLKDGCNVCCLPLSWNMAHIHRHLEQSSVQCYNIWHAFLFHGTCSFYKSCDVWIELKQNNYGSVRIALFYLIQIRTYSHSDHFFSPHFIYQNQVLKNTIISNFTIIYVS